METLEDVDQFCVPQELVGPMHNTTRRRVFKHLETGRVYWGSCGTSWCRFFCGILGHKMGSADLTDGAWFWPSGLAHYVREHGIVLPDEFIAYVMKRKGTPLPEDVHLKPNFWTKWCAAHRHPELFARLRQAKTRADEQVAEALARLEEQVGIGSTRCAVYGCKRKVLIGREFCGLHFGTKIRRFYALTPELLQLDG